MPIRLLLVDDHAVVRTGLRLLLEHEADLTIIGEAGSAREALARLLHQTPEVVVMDIGLPDQSGITLTREIKQRWPQVAVVALTIHEDEEYFFQMLHAGASGYVPKRAAPEELLEAVRLAAAGEIYLYPALANALVRDFVAGAGARGGAAAPGEPLTDREQEVLAHVAEGHSTSEIAAALAISPKTVGRHRENLMRKLNLHSRTELVKYAIRRGIIQA